MTRKNLRNLFLKRRCALLLLFFLTLCDLATYAQKKNLVWREDFGVVADSMRMDFADPKHTMPGHKCQLDTTQSVQDGTYAIVNSTAWAFPPNRPDEQRFFKLGRDHTGNKDGAMLVVNTDGRLVDKVIYEQTIDFPLCSANKYHLCMFAASITSFTCMQASLEIRVLGDGSEEIASKETGEIAWWEPVNADEQWTESPMKEHQWAEFGIDFDSEGYKSITIQIINRAKCTEDGRDPSTLQEWEGCDAGNDFAIDDISLYRYDQDEVPETEVAGTTVTSQNKLNADCIYTSSYTIPLATLESWKKIYPSVYFLWQVSEDGHTWSNLEKQSGVDKMEMETEADATKTLRYRVIITGGMTEEEGKTVALQIAKNGGPDDGCYKYSISNTLAAAKMQADCTYNPNLKKIWKEDFGLIDSFATKPYGGMAAGMTFFNSGKEDSFDRQEYVVATAVDSAIVTTGWNKYPEGDKKGIATAQNDAFLYVNFGKASDDEAENLMVDQSISGPFCNCKSFIFSFTACHPGASYEEAQVTGRIIDEQGNVLGEETFKFRGSDKNKSWSLSSTAFDIPKNYKGSIRVQILNASKNEYNKLAIDNLEVAVCGDLLPDATIGIDNSTLAFLGGFDCAEEPFHTFDLKNKEEWARQFSDYGYAWQYTTDGGENWAFYKAESKQQIFDNGEGGLVEFRAVVAESEAIAEAIAKSGKPSDPCDAYVFSNTIGFDCKMLGCKAPSFAFASKDTIKICNDQTENVEISVEQTNKVNVDEYLWYSSAAGENKWVLMKGNETLSISVLPSETTDYLFLAKNDTCFSDSLFARIIVNEAISLKEIEDNTLCVNSDLELEATALTGKPTQFIWNGTASDEATFALMKITEKSEITLSATDGVCSSEEMTIKIEIEDSVRIDLRIDKEEVCLGEEISLSIATKEDDTKVYTLRKEEYGTFTNLTLGETYSEVPENPTTYILTGTSGNCPTITKEVSVAINEIPTAPAGTLKVDYLMSDAENGSFKNLLEQDPAAVLIEEGYTYRWYDEAKKPLSAVPTPAVPDASNTTDISHIYYIERESEKGCVSEMAAIVVNIYSSPAPKTEDLEYCLGETAQPLTAEISLVGENTEADFDLIWYAEKEGGTPLDEAPTPSTTKAGTTTYYVLQRNKRTTAESGRVPLTVTIHEVTAPTLGDNKTAYCRAEEPEVLKATATDSKHTLVWTLDGETTSANSINTHVNATTTYTYKVHQTFAIAEGHVCEGPAESIDVKVTSVDVPTGTFSVSYNRLEAENNGGSFANNLLEQDPEAATATNGHTLLWYDANKNLIGETAPTPSYDANWEAGAEVSFTYFVAQREDESDCIGEMQEVTVTINDAPKPTVTPLNYCLNDKPTNFSFKEDLISAVKISTIPGGEPESHYRLVWFATENEYKTNADAGKNEPELVPNTDEEGVQTFFVCQKNTITNALSTPSKVSVTVHALPTITTKEIPAKCSYDGEMVEFDLNDGLDHSNDPIMYEVTFYSNATLIEQIDAIVNKAGAYYMVGKYHPTTDLTCQSKSEKIAIEIHEMTTPVISGDATVCPGATATLEATATSQNTNELIQYSWTCDKPDMFVSSSNYQITANPFSETKGDEYRFTVTATSGVCQKESEPFVITVGDAPLVGSLVIKETGVDEPLGTITKAFGNEIYACGGGLTFTTNFEKTEGNYIWSNGLVGETIEENSEEGSKTYTLSFTNKCPATVEFTIHTIPVSIANELEDFDGCEGEELIRQLEVNCQEKEYNVTWTTPAGEKITGTGASGTLLDIRQAQMSDNGTFNYEVTNRACKVAGSFESHVKEAIKFEADETVLLERGHDTTLVITFPQGKPQLIEWKENGKTVNVEDQYDIRGITADHHYEVVMTDPNYCETKTTMDLLVDASLMLTTTLKDSICANESTILVVDTTGTGACRDESKVCKLVIKETIKGFSTEITQRAQLENGIYTVEVSPTEFAIYTATLTYGERAVESSNELVVLPPVLIQSVPNPVVCGDESITFEVEVSPSEALIQWEADASIKGKSEGKELTVMPTFTNGNAHKEIHPYNFTVYYAFCQPVQGTVNVRVDEPFGNESIEGESIICFGNSTRLSAASFEAEHYQWNNADSSKTASINVAPEETTTYKVAMSRGECKAEASFELTIASLPVITSIDSIGVRSRYIKTETGPGSQPFLYWVDNKTASESPKIEELSFAKHVAHVEDANGCTAEMEFVMHAPQLSFKPFFSPNGDGINDEWDIASLTEIYPNSIIKIFDRAGKLIFEGNASEGSWDGTYNGHKMPATDYWYEVNIPEVKKIYVGHFTLLRSN